jgi:chorismate mutase
MATMPVEARRAALEARRRQLDEEIRAYPTPIPRCDAQFNHLFEERARIVRELAELQSGRDGT